MHRWLLKVWYGGGGGGAWLVPFAAVYAAVVAVREAAYRLGWLSTREAGCPVVVVGNLTVGGTGKTPFVAWLAQRLTQTGLRVGIVSRGYGGSSSSARLVRADSSWREVGDEPVLLFRRTGCDTVVARDRVQGARMLVERGAQIVLADDGLQHRALARDCEILLVDGTRGTGNGRLLPAGPLREPVGRLHRAPLVVVTGPAQHPSLARCPPGERTCWVSMSLRGDHAYPLSGVGERRPLTDFRGRRVHAVAGIGNPGRFFDSLRERGVKVVEHAFEDHHGFVATDLDFRDGLPVLLTEKDAVKCADLGAEDCWYVPVDAALDACDELRLMDEVRRRVQSRPKGAA